MSWTKTAKETKSKIRKPSKRAVREADDKALQALFARPVRAEKTVPMAPEYREALRYARIFLQLLGALAPGWTEIPAQVLARAATIEGLMHQGQSIAELFLLPYARTADDLAIRTNQQGIDWQTAAYMLALTRYFAENCDASADDVLRHARELEQGGDGRVGT